MFNDLKKLMKSLTHQDIKLNIELLSSDILVPERTQEYAFFSIQGNLIIDTPISKRVNNITIKFGGSLDNFKATNSNIQKPSIVHNKLKLISEPIDLSVGCSVFGFELALSRSLPSSINSALFKLEYSLTALIEFEGNKKLTKNIIVKVYNDYLLPLRETHQSYYESYGNAQGLIGWRIIFDSRLFNVEDFVKFKLKLEPRGRISISSINAKLVQETLIFSDTSGVIEGEGIKPTTQFISQCNFNLVYKYSENIFEIKLPITTSPTVIRPMLIPTMYTQHFDITHKIFIEVGYMLSEDIPKKKFSINIPVAICSNINAFTKLDLPIYDNIGENSNLFPISEYPPIYSI